MEDESSSSITGRQPDQADLGDATDNPDTKFSNIMRELDIAIERFKTVPLGFINIRIGTIDNIVNISGGEDYVIEISVVSTTGDLTSPGPPPRYSNPAVVSSDQLVFNHEFQHAPIRTLHAQVVIRLRRGKPPTDSQKLDQYREDTTNIMGEASVNLAALSSQQARTFRLKLTKPPESGGGSKAS